MYYNYFKITTRRIIVVTIIIRNITGVMVVWIVIRYIIIVGTNKSRFRTFTKVIIVIIKIITWKGQLMLLDHMKGVADIFTGKKLRVNL